MKRTLRIEVGALSRRYQSVLRRPVPVSLSFNAATANPSHRRVSRFSSRAASLVRCQYSVTPIRLCGGSSTSRIKLS